ncbi:MAG: hypothetical protein Q9181_005731 [Wetmoreana brouardii]
MSVWSSDVDFRPESHKVCRDVSPTRTNDDKATAYSKPSDLMDNILLAIDRPQAFRTPSGFFTDIYECCLQMFLGTLGVREGEKSMLRRLRTQAERFALWGEGFDARRGELDLRLFGADVLKRSLCNILIGTGEVLVNLARYIEKDKDLAATCSRLQHLKTLAPEELIDSTRLEDQGFDDDIMASLEELNSETPASGTDELDELLRDLESYNTCLYGLVPVLEESGERFKVYKDRMQNASRRKVSDSTVYLSGPILDDTRRGVNH